MEINKRAHFHKSVSYTPGQQYERSLRRRWKQRKAKYPKKYIQSASMCRFSAFRILSIAYPFEWAALLQNNEVPQKDRSARWHFPNSMETPIIALEIWLREIVAIIRKQSDHQRAWNMTFCGAGNAAQLLMSLWLDKFSTQIKSFAFSNVLRLMFHRNPINDKVLLWNWFVARCREGSTRKR